MLSTKLGYFRPARLAAAFAPALFFGVSFVCRLLFGAGLSQGSFFFVAMPTIRFAFPTGRNVVVSFFTLIAEFDACFDRYRGGTIASAV